MAVHVRTLTVALVFMCSLLPEPLDIHFFRSPFACACECACVHSHVRQMCAHLKSIQRTAQNIDLGGENLLCKLLPNVLLLGIMPSPKQQL